jgi:hypothetical protein
VPELKQAPQDAVLLYYAHYYNTISILQRKNYVTVNLDDTQKKPLTLPITLNCPFRELSAYGSASEVSSTKMGNVVAWVLQCCNRKVEPV